MRRRASPSRGFFGAFALNLLFRLEWFVLALILLILYIFLHLPLFLYLCLAAIGVWLTVTLVVTLLVAWAASCSEFSPGPGAKRTSQRVRKEDLA